MIFNKISIDGFGIIGKKVTINFPSDGKIGISGDNESGKSTINSYPEFNIKELPEDADIITQIQEIINTRIKPAAEQMGGSVTYKAFN